MRKIFGDGKSTKYNIPETLRALRTAADIARDEGRSASAAFFYSKLVEMLPNDAGLRLQAGHMLKESGLFAKARSMYGRARELAPTDPEPVVQSAILAKIEGDFGEAAGLFERAIALGYPNQTFLAGELAFLRHSGPPVPARRITPKLSIYLSSAAPPVRDDDPRDLKKSLGAANYSYGYVLRGFQSALEAAGYECQIIQQPEFFPDIGGTLLGQAIHIGFYPPDGPRFLKGAYNITCVAWEFERLRSYAEVQSYHAFADPTSMLARADEVWSISSYGAEAVRRANVKRVKAVPTPVPLQRQVPRFERADMAQLQRAAMQIDRIQWTPLAIWPAMQSSLSGQANGRRGPLVNWFLDADWDCPPVLFLCVFNVHDFRKQVKPLLEAFVRFAEHAPNAYLLLKVSCIDSDKLDINSMMFMDQVSDAGEMTAPLICDRVLMTTDALTRVEMNTLNDLASYYVCTSYAEGQNLPLIEAMAAGVVPVSVDHTAMKDYISAENAIIVPSCTMAMNPRLTSRYGIYGVDTHYVSARDVFDAMVVAIGQSDHDYAMKSKAALETVRERIGPEGLLAALRESLDVIAAKLGTQ